jgi:AcrR family transcriptional regulator
MAGKRQDRQVQKRRELLERTLDLLERGGSPESLGLQSPADLEAVLFHDHADLVSGLAEVLERKGLVEAFQAYACHLEEDRDLFLRRLALAEADAVLRGRRAVLEQEYREAFAAHFRRWGAAGPQGERLSSLEADLALAALRGAERLWVQGGGRPVLPVLAQEAVALVWPALYAHARRHQGR